MAFEMVQDGERLTITLIGRLDAESAPQLSDAMNATLDGIKAIVFNLDDLEYVSSAGLRVLLASYKLMDKREGTMQVQNAKDSVMEVLEMSGFAALFGCEQ